MDADLLIRVVAFLVGWWNAGHYFVGANQLRKAAHWEKLILFPALVAGNVGMCFAAVFSGSGMVMLVGAGLYFLHSIKDVVIWRAGAYMSDVLDKRQRMREAQRQAYNVWRSDLTKPYENVADLVTPSGLDELERAREKERA